MSTLETRPLNAHIWPREKDDWYVEPHWCSARLFEEEPFEGGVYDPACGLGRIVVSALKAGLQGYGSDLVNRGWDSTRTPHDFLASACDEYHDNIATNVPFAIAPQFARHALKLARRKVAMILPLARLNAARWLQQTPLARVWLLTPRPSMPPGRVILAGEKPGGDTRDFCWLVWSRGYVGKPELRWLHRDRTPTAKTAE
jgi:hypothetical protein